MTETIDTSDDALSLFNWQALEIFGEAAISHTLADAKWVETYPHVLAQLRSTEPRARYDAILPGAIVQAIAKRDDCKDAYFADPDGIRLYGVQQERLTVSAANASRNQLIPTPEALLAYEAYCLFSASDRGVGYKGEKDLSRKSR